MKASLKYYSPFLMRALVPMATHFSLKWFIEMISESHLITHHNNIEFIMSNAVVWEYNSS